MYVYPFNIQYKPPRIAGNEDLARINIEVVYETHPIKPSRVGYPIHFLPHYVPVPF